MDRGVCFNQLKFLKKKKLMADVSGGGENCYVASSGQKNISVCYGSTLRVFQVKQFLNTLPLSSSPLPPSPAEFTESGTRVGGILSI